MNYIDGNVEFINNIILISTTYQ